MNESIETIVTIIRHRGIVASCMSLLSHKIAERGIMHDMSKLSSDEFDGYVKVKQVARDHPYGTKKHHELIQGIGVTALHFSRNSHHPEYHKNGVEGMSLLDIIEMVCDWKAASETYGRTSFEDSIEISVKRFELTPEQEYVVRLIAKELE